jgi:hypothetical protein
MANQMPVATQFHQQHHPHHHHQPNQQQTQQQQQHQVHQHHQPAAAPGERVVVERRRAASDDYIQSICSQKYSDEDVQKIQIPVSEAQSCDPSGFLGSSKNDYFCLHISHRENSVTF